MKTIQLKEGWYFRETDGSKWTPVTVPGSVLSGLLEAKKMQDPYYRENEYEARELLSKDYSFETEFQIDKELLKKSNQILVCEGLDTLADVYLNGTLIGKADNMHRIWRFSCRNILQEHNSLRIDFSSALTYIRNYEEEKGKEIDQTAAGAISGNQYIRKAHAMFGWDWGAQLPDIGIWRDIHLDFYDDTRIEEVRTRQNHTKKDADTTAVGLEVEVLLESFFRGAAIEATLTAPDGSKITARPSLYQKTIEGKETGKLYFEIEDAKLWWPNGLGEHPLYELCVQLKDENKELLDEKRLKLGLRTISVSREADEFGNEFAFVVNGIKIFAKGADYIPEDCVYPWISQKRLEFWIDTAVKSNYNMLRIWGGGYYPADAFYDLCDENGILLWQDLMYACNVYNLTDKFEENIRQETIDNVRRLRHHASLALWCGNNEQEAMWINWGTADRNSPALMADYIKMYEYILPNIIKQEDPVTDYWPSSPSSRGSFDDPENENFGDAHYWAVWHGGKPIFEYRDHYFRFCSEFGFQSFPEKKTVESYTLEEDRNIFSPVMESHQKNGTANGKILNYLSDNFRYPKDFDSLLYVSQILQGIAVKSGVEHFRRHRGRCMGSLYWQLNDEWPVASWASVDYYGRWKALNYMARDFYADRAGSMYVKDNKVIVGVANETFEDTQVTITVRIRDMQLNTLYEDIEKVSAKALSGVEVWKRDMTQTVKGRERSVFAEVIFVWEDGTVTKEMDVFVPYKHLELPRPDITTTVEQKGENVEIRLKSDCFAPFVNLELPDTDLVWERNYFYLTEKETVITIHPDDIQNTEFWYGRTAQIMPQADEVEKTLKIMTLRDSY